VPVPVRSDLSFGTRNHLLNSSWNLDHVTSLLTRQFRTDSHGIRNPRHCRQRIHRFIGAFSSKSLDFIGFLRENRYDAVLEPRRLDYRRRRSLPIACRASFSMSRTFPRVPALAASRTSPCSRTINNT
jgi:hypothetical protein